MGNFGKRNFCVNSDCPSNNLNEEGTLLARPQIIYLEDGRAFCKVCEYSITEFKNPFIKTLLSGFEGGLVKNV